DDLEQAFAAALAPGVKGDAVERGVHAAEVELFGPSEAGFAIAGAGFAAWSREGDVRFRGAALAAAQRGFGERVASDREAGGRFWAALIEERRKRGVALGRAHGCDAAQA